MTFYDVCDVMLRITFVAYDVCHLITFDTNYVCRFIMFVTL